MLIMPIDRITILLEQASEVEIPALDDAAQGEAATEADDAGDTLEDTLADTPAYRELAEALEGLTLPEVYELLAVAIMGESDNAEDAEDAWELAVQEAQSIAVEDAVDELASALVLTDTVEIGLGRLGYRLGEDDEVDDEEEGEGEEEDESEAEAED